MSLPTQKVPKSRTHKRKSAYIRKQQVRLMNLARGLIGRAKGALKNKKPVVAPKDAVGVEKKEVQTSQVTKPAAKASVKKAVKAAPKKAK